MCFGVNTCPLSSLPFYTITGETKPSDLWTGDEHVPAHCILNLYQGGDVNISCLFAFTITWRPFLWNSVTENHLQFAHLLRCSCKQTIKSLVSIFSMTSRAVYVTSN